MSKMDWKDSEMLDREISHPPILYPHTERDIGRSEKRGKRIGFPSIPMIGSVASRREGFYDVCHVFKMSRPIRLFLWICMYMRRWNKHGCVGEGNVEIYCKYSIRSYNIFTSFHWCFILVKETEILIYIFTLWMYNLFLVLWSKQ